MAHGELVVASGRSDPVIAVNIPFTSFRSPFSAVPLFAVFQAVPLKSMTSLSTEVLVLLDRSPPPLHPEELIVVSPVVSL